MAARRAALAGFDVVEGHAARGSLIHQFLSALSHTRTDGHGGDLAGRSRFLVELVEAVRAACRAERPLFVRVSATEWAEGGWTLEQAVAVAKALRARGVDLLDGSSGGSVTEPKIVVGPGDQVPFARAVRTGAEIATAAVGSITVPEQAEQILLEPAADAVFLARELLANPHWPLAAARALRAEIAWPAPYDRAQR